MRRANGVTHQDSLIVDSRFLTQSYFIPVGKLFDVSKKLAIAISCHDDVMEAIHVREPCGAWVLDSVSCWGRVFIFFFLLFLFPAALALLIRDLPN